MNRVRLDGTQVFDWLLILLGLVLLASIFCPSGRRWCLPRCWPESSPSAAAPHKRLEAGAAAAAGHLTVLVLLAVLLPLAGLTALLGRQILGVFQGIRAIFQEGGVEGLLDRVPGPLRRAADWAVEMSGGPRAPLTGCSSPVAERKGGHRGHRRAQHHLHAVVEAVLLLIAFYFLLLDGQRLVRWLDEVLPWSRGGSGASSTSSPGVAGGGGVQRRNGRGAGAAALVGFLIARIPSALLWTLLTFFMVFIPAVGVARVSVVIAAVLFFKGQTGWALFLAVWGVVVVGLSDNVVKPLLIKGGVEMHGAVIFFALLGGLAAFGPVGLVVGPLVVAFVLALTGTRGVPSARES